MVSSAVEASQDLAYTYWIRHAAQLAAATSPPSVKEQAAEASRRALERLFRYFKEYDTYIGPGTQAALLENFQPESEQRAEHARNGWRKESYVYCWGKI